MVLHQDAPSHNKWSAAHHGHQSLREERVACLGKALFLDLHIIHVGASGEERTLSAAAQVERAGWYCRRFDSDTQARCGSVTVMVLVSSASGPRVRGCPHAPRYFRPSPLRPVRDCTFNLTVRATLRGCPRRDLSDPSCTPVKYRSEQNRTV